MPCGLASFLPGNAPALDAAGTVSVADSQANGAPSGLAGDNGCSEPPGDVRAADGRSAGSAAHCGAAARKPAQAVGRWNGASGSGRAAAGRRVDEGHCRHAGHRPDKVSETQQRHDALTLPARCAPGGTAALTLVRCLRNQQSFPFVLPGQGKSRRAAGCASRGELPWPPTGRRTVRQPATVNGRAVQPAAGRLAAAGDLVRRGRRLPVGLGGRDRRRAEPSVERAATPESSSRWVAFGDD